MSSSRIAKGPFVLLVLAGSLSTAAAVQSGPSPAGAGAPVPSPPGQDQAGPATPDARALFLANCARCHGEDGSGKGVTELDRPARSFKDGGFSYGNTPEAVERTITFGIPGTPMPAFGTSITEEERRALAAYVIGLGPEGVVVDAADTVLVVGDRPEVVRGFLPPIAEGADEHTRGLLIGTVDGLTFEYGADDVRLLGVRAGAFVERRDWVGRGGDPLQPLGTVVFLYEGGAPRPTFALDDANAPSGLRDLSARLASTWIRGKAVGLTSRLLDGERPVGRVEEAVRAAGTSLASGFQRVLRFLPDDGGGAAPPAGPLVVALGTLRPDEPVLLRTEGPERGGAWMVARRVDGTVETLRVRGAGGGRSTLVLRPVAGGSRRIEARWAATPDARLEVTTLSGIVFDGDLIEKLRKELDR